MSTTMTTTKHSEMKAAPQPVSQSKNGGEHAYLPKFQPQFDVWEGDEALILYADLPGVSSEDLDVHFEKRQLTVYGRVCRDSDEQGYLHREYGVGDFQRTFAIGEAINSDGISANLQNGVLTIHLPKLDSAKARRIKVKVD